MSAAPVWPWVAMVLLGAWHGVNPGMGWLFAAALGMQEGKGSAAWRALPPLALGHALAVGVWLAAAMALGLAVPPRILARTVAVMLIGYGILRLVRSWHPRWGGMTVGSRDLAVWSFLMASAHGAGLMVVPFFAGPSGTAGAGAGAHAHHLSEAAPAAAALGTPETLEALAAVLVHTGAYLAVTGALAVAVASWLGLRLLRALWVDLDRIWAGTLVLTGLLTLLV